MVPTLADTQLFRAWEFYGSRVVLAIPTRRSRRPLYQAVVSRCRSFGVAVAPFQPGVTFINSRSRNVVTFSFLEE